MTTATDTLRQQRVLLTGAAGKIGRRLREPLARLCRELVSTDVVPIGDPAPNERSVTCDLTDATALASLAQGVDAIVHFAGYPREAGWDTLIPANIVSVTNLWEAALKNGVRRVVYASTNHVVGFHPTSRHIGVDAETKCDSRYGVTKAFTESVARFYYEKYGIAALGLRIGRCEDVPTDERMLSTWIHPQDLVQQVVLGLTAPIRADILYGISDNAKAWCHNPDNPDLPYHPVHRADAYAIPAPTAGHADTTWVFQGGPFAQADYVGDTQRAAEFYLRPPRT
jgi:uronate dehydrogenase